jgi:hypothetical protein
MGHRDHRDVQPVRHLGQRFEHFPGLDIAVAVGAAHVGRDRVDDDQPDVADFLCLCLKQIYVGLEAKGLAARAIRLCPNRLRRIQVRSFLVRPVFGVHASAAGRTTYYFPIDHSSRYNGPVALDLAFRTREGFEGYALRLPGG